MELPWKNSVDVWCRRGRTYCEQGQYDRAIECYNRAIALDLGAAIARYCKGRALMAIGRYREAVNCFDQTVRIDPTSARAFGERALG